MNERTQRLTGYYDPRDEESFRAALVQLGQLSTELIAEGATSLRFFVVNIPNREHNPDYDDPVLGRRQIRVIADR